jgi:hypothetical protein
LSSKQIQRERDDDDGFVVEGIIDVRQGSIDASRRSTD